MRRIITPLLACIALLGIAASPALSRTHNHRSHQRRHHTRVRHHSRIRHRTFGSALMSPGSSTTSSGSSSSSNGNAGTVSSFTNGVLTITLTDGSMVSGKVTPETEIECHGAMAQDNENGDDNDANDAQDNSADNSGDRNDQGDDSGVEMQHCDASALQRNTVVREAELALTGNGASWDKVELLTAGSTTTSSNNGDDNDQGDDNGDHRDNGDNGDNGDDGGSGS